MSKIHLCQICLGTDLFGTLINYNTANGIFNLMRDYELNFVDTADSYRNGDSENMIGKILSNDRSKWVIATKTGNPLHVNDYGPKLNKNRLSFSVDNSLTRLKTDYIDIYYLHTIDPLTTLNETIDTLGSIIKSGKILNWGFSNFYSWQIPEMIRICDSQGVNYPVIAPNHYNLLKKTLKKNIYQLVHILILTFLLMHLLLEVF